MFFAGCLVYYPLPGGRSAYRIYQLIFKANDYLSVMNTKLKNEIIQKLAKTDDEAILNQIKEILESNEIVLWDELNPKLKESIEKGLEQSKKGMTIEHEEVMKGARNRLKK
jgi:hypothetical protein